ncbi:MAG: putative minor capsid protein 10B [Prokaryotic dsDNA virus sp.]|nr:MAG: putative minor capsid protein 10B [Prokaryotic dsDNA virus sp.]
MATSTGLANPAASQASDTELAVFIPEIWSDAVRAAFKKNLVLGNLGNDFSALIAGGGDIINVPSVADVAAAAAKSAHVPVNYTNATEDSLQITVQTHKYASAMLDDMGVVQASADLLSMYSDSIGYQLALGFDTDVEAALALTEECINIAGNTVAKTIDAATLAHISKVVMENNCPLNECTLVLNPTLYSSLFRIDDFIHVSKTGAADMPNGFVGSVMGMNVVLSNNITSTNANGAVDSDDGALNDNNVLGGFVVHKDALGYAFSKQPTMNSEYDIDYIAHKLVGDAI